LSKTFISTSSSQKIVLNIYLTHQIVLLDTKTQKILRLIDGQTVGWSLFSLFYQKTSSFKNSKKKSSLTNVSIELKSFWSNLLEFKFLCKKNAVGVFLSERVGLS
jgi:hypothetical protein